MAKGSISKEVIMKKILETFPEAFKYDKEIRIPMEENGETIQIKCALTCAKVSVSPETKDVVPAAAATETSNSDPTAEEIEELLKTLKL